MAGIPAELHEKETDPEPYGQTHYQKTLGIHWNAQGDQFHVSTSQLLLPAIVTKRALTSRHRQDLGHLGMVRSSHYHNENPHPGALGVEDRLG